MARNNLEQRLIDFAVLIVWIVKRIPKTIEGKEIASQLIRSGTSPALNYGEAKSAESRRDFIHKIKIVLKELRETHINLKTIYRANLNPNKEKIEEIIQECNELISIFVISVQTARRNMEKTK